MRSKQDLGAEILHLEEAIQRLREVRGAATLLLPKTHVAEALDAIAHALRIIDEHL